MNPRHLASYLIEAKQNFPPPRALLVVDDKTLRRYVLSWSPLLVRVVKDWPDDDSLAAVWACVEVDTEALGDLTGDSTPDVRQNLRRLQALELIYPDGTVPEAVSRVVNKLFNGATADD